MARFEGASHLTCRLRAFAMIVAALFSGGSSHAKSEFRTPWSNKERAIILDGYEHNSFNLAEIVKNSRVAAFIHKGSDGMPANYHCTRIREAMQQELCKRIWRNYSVSRELNQTRRALAKALGLKWGAYHLARPGNPIEQANHFIDYTEPTADELIAIDIEDNDPGKFMSLRDAEIFAEHVKFQQFGIRCSTPMASPQNTSPIIGWNSQFSRACHFGMRVMNRTSPCISPRATGGTMRSGSSRRRATATNSVALTARPAPTATLT